jgi:hypothetical protein
VRPKKPVKLPKSIWIVYEIPPKGAPLAGTGSIYTDPNDIGDLFDDEVVAHYHLAKEK